MQEWLTYYIKEHGDNAVVIYDNGSTAYSLDVLTKALADLDGMQAVAVVNVSTMTTYVRIVYVRDLQHVPIKRPTFFQIILHQ